MDDLWLTVVDGADDTSQGCTDSPVLDDDVKWPTAAINTGDNDGDHCAHRI